MFRRLCLFALGLPAFFIFSCEEAEETPDTTAPEVTVVGPRENGRVKGVIDISITAEDKSDVVSMQLFLDGSELTSVAGPHLDTQLDTKTLSEGVHHIKIIATDAADNSSETAFDFEVRNTLFELEVSSNYIESMSRIFFTLSRNDGTIITVDELVNSGTFTIATPDDFNPDSSFVYTEFLYIDQPTYLIKSTNVHTALTAGSFKTAEYRIYPPVVGTHQLEITDAPTSDYLGQISGRYVSDSHGVFGTTGMIKQDVEVRSTSSDLLVTLLRDGATTPTYKYEETIMPGGSNSFSANDMEEMSIHGIDAINESGVFDVALYGFSGNPSLPVHMFTSYSRRFEGSKMEVPYVPNVFNKLEWYIRYMSGDGIYMNRLSGPTLPSSLQYLNADVKSASYSGETGRLQVSSTGSFDHMMIFGQDIEYDGTFMYLNYYSVNFPEGSSHDMVVPNAPAELAQYELPARNEFQFETALFYDYSELSGASDYQSKVVFASDKKDNYAREHVGRTTTISTSTGGRLAAPERWSFPSELEGTLRRHVPHLLLTGRRSGK